MHAGLIYDLAGNKKEAAKRLEHAYMLDATALRIMQSYANFLSRNGSQDEALKMYKDFDKQLPRYPLASRRLPSSTKASRCRGLSNSAQAGAAEALYGLGAALGRREEEMTPCQSRPRLSSARALPRAQSCAGDACARRSLRGDEEAGTRDQNVSTAFRRTRRSSATPKSSSESISTASIGLKRPRSILRS